MVKARTNLAKKTNSKSKPEMSTAAPQASEASAPMPPPARHLEKLNDYSEEAAELLASMGQTEGADGLIEECRMHKRASRMFVDMNLEGLVTTQNTAVRQVVLEMNGFVSLPHEVSRPPGGGNGIFLYDGLMKGGNGEDVEDETKIVCIDTRPGRSDTRFTRRSCYPNGVLKHVLGSNATLGVMIVATKDILRNQEVTIPFDADWRDSDVELKCQEHYKMMHLCPYEQERRRLAGERARIKDEGPGKKEEGNSTAASAPSRRGSSKKSTGRKGRQSKAKDGPSTSNVRPSALNSTHQKENQRAGKLGDNQSGSTVPLIRSGKGSYKKSTGRKGRPSKAKITPSSSNSKHQKDKKRVGKKKEETSTMIANQSESTVPSTSSGRGSSKSRGGRHSKAKDAPSTSDVTPSASNSSTGRLVKKTKSVSKASSPTHGGSSSSKRSATADLTTSDASSKKKKMRQQ